MRPAIAILICGAAALGTMLTACSSGPTPVAEKKAEMPQDYPKEASEQLARLSEFVPADANMLAFASYGAVADGIMRFRDYHIVDDAEIDNLLRDLGTHYLLNPSVLKSYYQAGMHTGSGFVAGMRKNNGFAVIDILDAGKFRSWLDNFLNEEFGRPRYHETQEGNRTFLQIDILQKDFATVVISANSPAVLVFGADGSPSEDAAKDLVAAQMLGKSGAAMISANIQDAPIGFWSSVPDFVPSSDIVNQWIASFSAGLNFTDAGPEVQAAGTWQKDDYENMPRGKFVASLLAGTSAGHAGSILAQDPGSKGRVLFDAEKAESVFIPFLSERTQRQYADIKDKLTQRLLKLDVTKQIIHNIGGAWLAVYESGNIPSNAAPSFADIMAAQKLAVFLPFKDKNESDAFFAKVSALMNIVKGSIPQDMVKISQESGTTHVTANLSGTTLHAGYRNGMLALATQSAWPEAKQTLEDEKAAQSDSILAEDRHFAAFSVQTADITQILGAKYPIVKEQIERFIEHFSRIDMHASASDQSIGITLTAPVAGNTK